jgi:hypothetical protein
VHEQHTKMIFGITQTCEGTQAREANEMRHTTVMEHKMITLKVAQQVYTLFLWETSVRSSLWKFQ